MNDSPPYVPANIEACSVDPDAEDFRRLVIQHGTRVWWEQSMPCPCGERSVSLGSVTTSLDVPDGNCAACHGTGILYFGGQQIPAMVLQAKDKLEWYQLMGELAAGHAMFTLLPEHLPSSRDRYTLMDDVLVYVERRVRKTTVETPRYPIIQHTTSVGTVGSLATPVDLTQGVIYLRGANAAGVVQAELLPGVDFDLVPLSADGQGYAIDWTKGDVLETAPAVGSRYSLRYYARPRFVAVEDVYAKRAYYIWSQLEAVRTAFPTAVLARLEHAGWTHGEKNPDEAAYAGSVGLG